MIIVSGYSKNILLYRANAIVNVDDNPGLVFESRKPYFWFPISEVNPFGYGPFFGALRVCMKYGDIVIHCAAGANRSPTVAYAVWKAMGMPYDGIKGFDESTDPAYCEKMYNHNMKYGRVEPDTIDMLKYAAEHPDASMVECLNAIGAFEDLNRYED